MKKLCLSIFLFFAVTAQAQTLYLVAPAELDSSNLILTAQGLNRSLSLIGTFVNLLGSSPPSLYLLTANPQMMQSNAPGQTCDSSTYLEQPYNCLFDSTPFATLDPLAVFYNIELMPSSATSSTDFADAINDIQSALTTKNTLVMSWTQNQSSNLITNLGCTVPSGFTASPGQIVKMTMTNSGGTWSCSNPTLLSDGLNPSTAFLNYMNQNANVTAHYATTNDKYFIFIRHGEKEEPSGELTCFGLNRALATAYYLKQKFGVADLVFGGSLTLSNGSVYASRALEKIEPYAILNDTNIKALPVDMANTTPLGNLINNLLTNYDGHLYIFGWEHDNANRIADAMIANDFSQGSTNTPFYWDNHDYDQIEVVHYKNISGTWTLQNDYYLSDEQFGSLVPDSCGILPNLATLSAKKSKH